MSGSLEASGRTAACLKAPWTAFPTLWTNWCVVFGPGSGRARSNAYIDEGVISDVGDDIFNRGLCLPSDNKMTIEEQDVIIELIHRCFD